MFSGHGLSPGWLHSTFLCYFPVSSQESDQSDQGLGSSCEETSKFCPRYFCFTSERVYICRVILTLTTPAVLQKDNLICKERKKKSKLLALKEAGYQD